MVVGWERVPNAILVVMVLAMSNIFCVAHSHLFTTIPAWRKKRRYIPSLNKELLYETRPNIPNLVPSDMDQPLREA